MKKPTVVALAMLAAGASAVAQQSPLTLWYDKPAVLWTDALPTGNASVHKTAGLSYQRVRGDCWATAEAPAASMASATTVGFFIVVGQAGYPLGPAANQFYGRR